MRQQKLKGLVEREDLLWSYQLPKGWRLVKLGDSDVAEINPSKREIKDIPDDTRVSFIPMEAVDEKKGGITKLTIKKLGDVRKGYTYFKEGDVIFAKITPCMENSKCAIAENLTCKLGFGSTEFHVVRPLNNLSSKWIHFYLRQETLRKEAVKYFTGSVGQQRVPEEFLKNLVLPLPPLEEQKRIVTRIEELFAKIDEIKRLRKGATDEARALMPAALHEVFSKPDEKGWKWIKLREVLKKDRKTINPLDYPDEKFWHISMDCIETGTGNLLSKVYLRGSEIKSIKYKFNSSHILYGKLRPYLNKVYSVPNGENGICTTEFIPLVVENADKEFIARYLRTKYVVDFAMNNLTGTRQPRTDIDKLLDFKVPLPSIEEQKRVVKYLDGIQEKTIALEKRQQETERETDKLKESILHKAFRGKLTN